MTIPPLDATYPFCAQTLPAEGLPTSTGSGGDVTPLLVALVKQSLNLVRSSSAWKKGKQFGQADPKLGGKVQALYCPSAMEGRLKKCGWHARLSKHNPSSSGLSFEDLYDGLGTEDHTLNEAGYISDILEALKIDTILPGRAEVWRNSYNLPTLTSNRDFVELVVTLPLPPSPEPFSPAHEEVILNMLSAKPPRLPQDPGAVPTEAGSKDRRSFLVISLPVAHASAPERPNEFVRAKYASVEAVWESQHAHDSSSSSTGGGAGGEIEWFMAVQSDSSGKIPLMFQEMAMPGKIAHDVPLFFEWARRQKERHGRVGHDGARSVKAVGGGDGAQKAGAEQTPVAATTTGATAAAGAGTAAATTTPAAVAGDEQQTTTTTNTNDLAGAAPAPALSGGETGPVATTTSEGTSAAAVPASTGGAGAPAAA